MKERERGRKLSIKDKIFKGVLAVESGIIAIQALYNFQEGRPEMGTLGLIAAGVIGLMAKLYGNEPPIPQSEYRERPFNHSNLIFNNTTEIHKEIRKTRFY